MAKNSRSKSALAQKEQAKSQQKKQAKKEAKAMLAIERVKDSLEKAQDKLVRVQARVEVRTAHLHNLEMKLAAARSTSPATPLEAPDSSFDHQGEQADTQELATGTDVPSTSSSNGEHHASAAHIESETASNTTTAKTTTKPRTPRARTPRRMPVKPSTSAASASSAPSTSARRTTTRKPASTTKTPPTTPEAANGNISE